VYACQSKDRAVRGSDWPRVWPNRGSNPCGSEKFLQNRPNRHLAHHSPLHLVPRLGMSGAVPLLPHMSSWRGRGKRFYFTSRSVGCWDDLTLLEDTVESLEPAQTVYLDDSYDCHAELHL
jgi:hypothetical protein